jgi:uncharacterized protein (DUF4415 family)
MESNKKLGPPPPPDFDDDAPVLTDEQIKQLRPARKWFAEQGIPMPVPRGRPKAAEVKTSVTIRLDDEVVHYYKSGGPGWQTRLNDDLLEAVRKKRA